MPTLKLTGFQIEIDLNSADLYDRLLWYSLYRHDGVGGASSSATPSGGQDPNKDHLSPPSSVSRLSDCSDVSEMDHDEYDRQHNAAQYSSSDTLLVPDGSGSSQQRFAVVPLGLDSLRPSSPSSRPVRRELMRMELTSPTERL